MLYRLCPLIDAILNGLFRDKEPAHGVTQKAIIIGWLASAVLSLYGKQPRPGQAIAFAGPPGCGKSVMQNKIITPLLGGRSAKAALFMQGRTHFNADLFQCEHLMLEDESSDTDIRSRLNLSSNLKQIAVNEVQSCHGKGKQIVPLKPWWRLSISLNDDPERLLILPPLNNDVADKIIILRASAFVWPMPTSTGEQWAEMMEAVAAEMPAFLNYLLGYSPMPEHQSDRYGVKEWHHPDLVAELADLAPEAAFAELLAQYLKDSPAPAWRGTAHELRTALFEHESTQRDARDLLKWPGAAGSYLGRLAKKGHRLITVDYHRTGEAREWEVHLR